MRHSINVLILCAGSLLSAPVYAAPDEVLLDEITIRVIENENSPIDFNNLTLPPARGKSDDKRQVPSENAAEQGAENASRGAEKAAKAAENAAEAASRAAENAAAAREKAVEAAKKGKGKGKGLNK